MDKRRTFTIASVHRRRGHPLSTQTPLSLPASLAIVRPHAGMTLNAEKSQAFVDQLSNPSKPSVTLQVAAARYWARVDQSPSSPVY